ncbi:MAG TPA: RHS repeat-associated core domain-containing protein, partial [Chitinophagaceae bacterium]|nr:RHS repeat-associated core domain-containing protein [Chitinophagaceae bacterium]
KISMKVNSWYDAGGASPAGNNSLVDELISVLTNNIPTTSAGKLGSGTLNSTVLQNPVTAFSDIVGNSTNTINTKPKAHLNYVLLNEEQLAYIEKGSGCKQVGENAVVTTLDGSIEVPQNGYLYIYTSNETKNIDVYFDELQVTHTRGALLEEMSYYPFGGQIAGLHSKAAGGLQSRIGFQGQEYEEDLGLNLYAFEARQYDAQIGRWHVPDPRDQFHSPYMGMGNRPTASIDPDGRFLFLLVAIGAAVFGTGNLVAKAINGEIHNLWDGLKAFGTGALAGAVIGTGVAAGLGVPILGPIIKGIGYTYAATTGVSVFNGVAAGVMAGDWSMLENAGKILLGNFYLDGNRSFLGQVWQGVSRFSWEALQTTIGSGYAQTRNAIGDVTDVEYFGGATLVDSRDGSNDRNGTTLGPFINGKNIGKASPDNDLFMHEYGHTLQSNRLGLLYPFIVGIPSIISAATEQQIDADVTTHEFRWYEMQANRLASKYAEKYYPNSSTGSSWNEINYPRRRR